MMHRHNMLRKIFTLFFLYASPLLAEEYKIIDGDSIMAVVVQKGGPLARLAHNHFVYATNYHASLLSQGNTPETLRFQLSFATTDLNNDLFAVSSRWYPRIKGANILPEPFVEISDSDRQSIRHTMLSADQLDAERFPEIKVSLLAIRPYTAPAATHLATIVLSVHGHDETKEVPVMIKFTGDQLDVEGYAPFLFTDFGIEPFKALGGAMRNENKFYIYTCLKAMKAG